MRSDSFARRGSAAISVQRSRLNLVCDLRSGSSIMIGTPGRYVRNGKRHKEQKPSKKAAVVCAWVSGRGCRDVSSLRDRLASEWDGQRAPNRMNCNKDGTIARSVKGHGYYRIKKQYVPEPGVENCGLRRVLNCGSGGRLSGRLVQCDNQTGIPTEARPFVPSLQEKLISTSRNTDRRFPQNESAVYRGKLPCSSSSGIKPFSPGLDEITEERESGG